MSARRVIRFGESKGRERVVRLLETIEETTSMQVGDVENKQELQGNGVYCRDLVGG